MHYVPEYIDVPMYIEMPPAKDKIKRNIKEIYINPKDYIIEAESSESSESEEVIGCPNCHGHYGYGHTHRAWGRGNADISALFDH